jgi:hypothetical protein
LIIFFLQQFFSINSPNKVTANVIFFLNTGQLARNKSIQHISPLFLFHQRKATLAEARSKRKILVAPK